jgi:CRISPR-associated protein Cas1
LPRVTLAVANSALSYLYTVLLGECVSALYAAELDPSIGVLHAEQERRASLGLDLMEEFRPLIEDQLVLAAARSSELRCEHARREPGRSEVL